MPDDPGKPKNLNQIMGDDLAKTVRDVLKGRLGLDALTDSQRVEAARWYREVAERTGGAFAAQARAYNIARAEYLEGSRGMLSPTLPEFMRRGGH